MLLVGTQTDCVPASAPISVTTLHGHNGAVYSLEFQADGAILAAAGDDEMRLWAVDTE
jgi:hypothetical protein